MSENFDIKPSGGMASKTKTPATASTQGEHKPKAMDAQGFIGRQFTEHGAIGGTANKIGGPLGKDGIIGKQFTTEGSIGRTVQNAMGGTKPNRN